MASPSGSDEPLPLKLTAPPSAPEYGPPGAAVGAWFVAATVTALFAATFIAVALGQKVFGT